MFETILVPTDGSDGANRAVEHALELAERFDTTVHALYVVDTDRYGEPAFSSTEIVLNELEEEGGELLSRIERRADNEGVDVETHCVHGTPHETIVSMGDEIGADLILLGYQGQQHTEHIGSVTDRVVRTADRPVLIA